MLHFAPSVILWWAKLSMRANFCTQVLFQALWIQLILPTGVILGHPGLESHARICYKHRSQSCTFRELAYFLALDCSSINTLSLF